MGVMDSKKKQVAAKFRPVSYTGLMYSSLFSAVFVLAVP